MSSEEATPAVEAPAAAAPAETAPKPASRTRPSSTVDAKKKIARPSVPGAKKGASSGGAGASKKASGAAADKSFNPGDIVLARLKGYPPWPARIANADDVPSSVKAARPTAGRPSQPGKKTNLYAVEYFPVGDYSWTHSRDLEHLSPKAIKDFLNEPRGRATGDLKRGYQVAQDPTEWDAEQKDVRQAKEDALNQVDELEDEDEDVAAGKRKKSGKDKSKKKAKTAQSVEVEDEEDDKPKPKAKATKAKADKSTAKSAAAKPEPAAPVDDDPLSTDPECVKVKDWRHKLQRAFLGKAPPSADEMPTYDTLFKTIEEYKDITIDALTYSKIGKVMKKIATLTNIARNDEFKITDRASKLMQDWQDIVGGNKTAGANGNGDAAKDESKEETETKGESAPAPEMSAADPAVNGTGEGEASGEKVEADSKMDQEPVPAE